MSDLTNIHIALIAGSASSEHDISLVSANTIALALKTLGATFYPLYLDKNHQFFLLDSGQSQPYNHLECKQPVSIERDALSVKLHDSQRKVIVSLDLAFPVLHGRYGEDGAIQGYFELLKLPYVGSGVSASSLGMDKELTKQLLSCVGIATLPHAILKKDHQQHAGFDELCQQLHSHALFVKPARAGSSLGISKVEDADAWLDALKHAFTEDEKLLIEPAKQVRELEVAVLEDNGRVKASGVGEISYDQGFYDYEQKYSTNSKVRLSIPATIDEDLIKVLQQKAILAHQTLGCKGLSRVDFFLTQDQNLYLNEINTFPGFTAHSMYPMLWQAAGISIENLVAKLIFAAIKPQD